MTRLPDSSPNPSSPNPSIEPPAPEFADTQAQARSAAAQPSNAPSAASRPRTRPAFRPVGAPIRAPSTHVSAGAGKATGSRSHQKGVKAGERAPHRRLLHLWRTAFINRDFTLIWWGQTVSTVGDYAWDTALVLWVANTLAHNQSWAPIAISGVIVAAALPQIVVGPIAGVFVDRWDRRRTMIISTAIQAILAFLLIPVLLGLNLPVVGSARLHTFATLGVVYADVALVTICAQFYLPAMLALIRDIVPGEQEDQAQEMTQAIQGLAVVIGPPVAAALVFGVGISWAILLNSLSFVVALVAALAIRAPAATTGSQPAKRGRFMSEFRDGIRYVLGHTVLRTILVAESLTWLGFGALQALGYFFITENLNAPPEMYGYFGAVFGLGAILGGALVTLMGHSLGLERILWVALVTSGVFVIVMSHLTSFPLAMVAAFLFGVSATAIIVTAGPLAIDATERGFIGRVMAVINPVGRLAAFVSVILAGALVSTVLVDFHVTILGIRFGPVDTVFTGTGLLAVAGGLYARASLRGASSSGGSSQNAEDAEATYSAS